MKKYIAIAVLSIMAVFSLPSKTYAASLYLTPSTGKIQVGDEFTVSVITDSQGQAINTAETNINFTSSTLELLSVTQGSTFLIPTPASPNKGTSSAYFGGGLPNPGFNGKDGILGVMRFKAKAVGQASVTINRGNVLLNDGQGTTAVTQTAGASFTITALPAGSVIVTSPTHPDSYWVKNTQAEFDWTMPLGAYGVSYSFDQDPNGVPDNTIDATSQTSTTFPNIQDGNWYFHIKARQKPANDPFGPVTTYKIGVDTVAPLPFKINLVAENDAQNASTTPTIQYSAMDQTSGVYRYDVYLDNHLVKELAASQFLFPKTPTGQHIIRVIAYDRAGNSTVADLPITVVYPGEQPVTYNFLRKNLLYPLYGLLLINLLVILAVAYLYSQRKKDQKLAAQVSAQMQVVQLAVEKIAGFETGLLRFKREVDMKFKQMSDIKVQAQTEIPGKLQKEVDRNIERISQQINIWFTEFSNTHTKEEMAKMQSRLEEQIQKEIDKNMQLLKQEMQQQDINEIRSRIEILEKLKTQVANSDYTNWRGRINPDNI